MTPEQQRTLNRLRVLTVCSGIGAPELAWSTIDGKRFEFVACSEIEAFSSAVLKHHFPKVPNLGDMTKFKEWPERWIAWRIPPSR